MKKIVCLIVLLAAIGVSFAQNKTQNPQLPQVAKSFIGSYFPECTIVTITENDATRHHFAVTLSSGVQLSFNEAGEWIIVETKSTPLPKKLLPANTKSYILSQYSQLSSIKRIAKVANRWEVTFFDGVVYLFDTNGNFDKIIHK